MEINKYILIAVAATLSLATAISIDIDISKQFNLPIYIMITLVIPAAFIFFVEKIKVSEISREFNSKDKKYFIITGFFWAFAIFFSLRSFILGSVTKIVPLQSSSVPLNVIIAYIVLGERKDVIKKLIAALLVILGIYLTVI